MSRMLRTATEQEAQLENVILHHQTFDVADFIASTMTTANSMAYLRIAYKAVEHISVRNNLLVSEAQRIEANIDISSHHAMRGRDFTDSMLADGDVEVLEQLSMSQRENRILDVSREVVKVRDWNRILTRSIEDKMNGKDRHQPYRNADGEQGEQAGGRRSLGAQESHSRTTRVEAERVRGTAAKPARGAAMAREECTQRVSRGCHSGTGEDRPALRLLD
ncbi:hypothetical protein Slin15195_G126390 [Septoria linicola]|uniref:Uncharacterized protein n=1 Tax=Septoria linicola TaxID=215465 RepID=A0A9Q9B6T9_9PEZI|nr:hypothetical protein Slin15195_G126390 [Septoria linicola]